MLHFKTGDNATAQGMWLRVKCGKYRKDSCPWDGRP